MRKLKSMVNKIKTSPLAAGRFLRQDLFGFALRLYAAGAGLNSFAIVNSVLEVGQEAHNAGAHAVGTLDGAAVSLSAYGAHSGHIFLSF